MRIFLINFCNLKVQGTYWFFLKLNSFAWMKKLYMFSTFENKKKSLKNPISTFFLNLKYPCIKGKKDWKAIFVEWNKNIRFKNNQWWKAFMFGLSVFHQTLTNTILEIKQKFWSLKFVISALWKLPAWRWMDGWNQSTYFGKSLHRGNVTK